MPGKLFELLWSKVTRQELFKATIKNRAKDDSHYWVQATIMPVVSNANEIIKYVGVRHLIADEEKASALYVQQARTMGLPY